MIPRVQVYWYWREWDWPGVKRCYGSMFRVDLGPLMFLVKL